MADIKEFVRDNLADFLDEKGLELWSVEYEKEGRDYFLRVFIDVAGSTIENTELLEEGEWSENYVSTDDCEEVSGYLSSKLDEADPIEENYYLEVSSPGMDRELITDRHFEKCRGQIVDVALKEAFEKQMNWQGVLVEKTADELTVEVTIDTKAGNRKPGAKISPKSLIVKNLTIPMDTVKSVRLAVIF